MIIQSKKMLERVKRMQGYQEKLLTEMYKLDPDDPNMEILNLVYDLTVDFLLEYHPFQGGAPVVEIDQDMAEVYQNVYKSEYGFRDRNASYNYAKKYLADRRC